MIPLTMEYLENCFNRAKELGMNYVGIKLDMDGFEDYEVIINPIENADAKLAYYKKTYNEDLEHKFAEGIRIVGFGFGHDFLEVQNDLLNTEKYVHLKFQSGPIQENGVNGTQIEDVIEVLAERLRGFQQGKFSCRENALAITALEDAQNWLWRRTRNRQEQGVEGRNINHV